MALLQKDFIQRVLDANHIEDVIGTRIELKKAGKDYTACCPFHEEKTPSFTVVPSKQFYHCFGCGAHGNAINFIMEHDKLDFRATIKELALSAGLSIPAVENKPSQHEEHKKILTGILSQVNDFYRDCLFKSDKAMAYLNKRGITAASADKYQIGYATDSWNDVTTRLGQSNGNLKLLKELGLTRTSDSGREYDFFRDRIIFPVLDKFGSIAGFGGRQLESNQGPKYINSPESATFDKGKLLYGLNHARGPARQEGYLILMEGYLDVIKSDQHGLHNASAPLGTALTESHVNMAYSVSNHIVFCFDGDKAGIKAALRAINVVLPYLDEKHSASIMTLPDGMDPDEYISNYGLSQMRIQIDKKVSVLDYLNKTLERRHDTSTIEGKVRYFHEAKDYLSSIPEGIVKDCWVQKIAESLKMTVKDVKKNLSQNNHNDTTSQDKNNDYPTAVTNNNQESDSKNIILTLIKKPEIVNIFKDRSLFCKYENGDAALIHKLISGIVTYGFDKNAVETEVIIQRLTLSQDEIKTLNAVKNMQLGHDVKKVIEEFKNSVRSYLKDLSQESVLNNSIHNADYTNQYMK